MQTRRFGRTGHHSTIAIFGAAAFWQVDQAQADATMRQVIEAGVNHIDVAPSYGVAEQRLGPWLARERSRFFLGCKTMERSKEGAAAEMRRSLELLQVDTFDLYQIHAVTSMAELDAATRRGGAIEALVEAREAGLIRTIGITGHGVDSPAVFVEALQRFDFDTVLFPVNFVQYANPVYRSNAEALLSLCRARDVGVMAIKAVAREPWGDQPRTATTWYRPFDDLPTIQRAVDFALSQDITGLCTTGDVHVLPIMLEACANFSPLAGTEQDRMISSAAAYEPLFS
jgi:aryl-alcohol dehydrogenase-like predicted oxidoreductase